MTVLATKIRLADTVGRLSRLSGRGGGTSLPGKTLLKLDRDAISKLSRQLEHGSVVISATNGKTTTAAMLSAILREAGQTTVTNIAGANLASGVATTLLGCRKRLRESLGLFEVDEAALKPVSRSLRPKLFLLSNLFRDQLDRYGELESVADSWSEVVSEHRYAKLVLCADDPLVATLGSDSENVTYFGIDDATYALPGLQHAADSTYCRRCESPYNYSFVLLGHLGHYSCPNCGWQRPTLDVAVKDLELMAMDGSVFTLSTPGGGVNISLPLPGLYNVYNALAAAAAAHCLEVDLAAIKSGLESFTAAFGRLERLTIGSVDTTLLLIKNPTGANEVLRTLASRPGPLTLLLALNDKIADGRDISWIWDADFEQLADAVTTTICTGTRAAEMALRLKYADFDQKAIEVDTDLTRATDKAVQAADRELFVLPTYTALLELKQLLKKRGLAKSFWSSQS